MQMRVERFRAGVRRMGAGFQQLGMMSMGASIGMGIGAKKALDFQKEMSAVGAITRANATDMRTLTDEAQRQGIVSTFSASQAAQAMQSMARAGFTTTQIIAGLGGVIDTAAAEGIDLATATNIVAGSLRSMSLEAKDTTRVADALALTSASTSTSMTMLGESFAYGGTTAKQLGMDLELTSATFGLLANKMITGSRAGTSLNAIFRGLTGSSKKQRDSLRALGVDMKKFGGDLSRLPEIIDTIQRGLNKAYGKDATAKFRAAAAIFGRQGVVAFNALAESGGKALTNLTNKLKKAGKAGKVNGKWIGAAAMMAKRRLDNVSGAMTLFSSSVESFFIATFQPFLKGMQKGIQNLTGHLNNLIFSIRELGRDPSMANQQKLTDKYGRTVVQVALGIQDAFKIVKEAMAAVRDVINEIGSAFGDSFGGTTIRQIAKVVTVAIALAGIFGPMLGGLMILKFVVGGVASVVIGALMAITAVAWPIVVVVGAIAAALRILRNDGESLADTAIRLLTDIYNFARGIYSDALQPLFQGIFNVIRAFTVEISGFWNEVAGSIKNIILGSIEIVTSAIKILITVLKPVGAIISKVLTGLRPVFMSVVRFLMVIAQAVIRIGQTVMNFFKTVARAAAAVISSLRPVINLIITIVKTWVTWITTLISKVVTFISRLISVVGAAFTRIWAYIIPIIKAVKWVIKLMAALGQVIWQVWVGALRGVFNWISKIVTWIWHKMKPGVMAVVNAFKVFLNFVVKIGSMLKAVILKPLRLMAWGLHKVLQGMIKMVSLIPGVTASSLRAMSESLRLFSEGDKKPVKRFRGRIGADAGRFLLPMWMTRKVAAEHAKLAEQKKERRKTELAKKAKPKIQLTDKRQINLKNTLCLDGREVAGATARHKLELNERAGYGTTPWQRRAVVARARDIQPPDK
jgi:TP901 family phage tail tape measure protein